MPLVSDLDQFDTDLEAVSADAEDDESEDDEPEQVHNTGTTRQDLQSCWWQ